MMRSMFSGVSGLNAHQTKMDVIGNNVANVNTVGFKSGRVLFQEVFSQTLQSAGSPDMITGQGGVNPMQVGLGLGISSVDTVMTRGSINRTDNPTDLSIEGEGFFILGSDTPGLQSFTRAGNFAVDKNGNVVNPDGLSVYGWVEYDDTPDQGFVFNSDSAIEPINIFEDDQNGNKKVIAPQETTEAVFAGNLDSSIEPLTDELTDEWPERAHYTSPFTAYDAKGNEYRINIEFFKVGTTEGGTQWDIRVKNATTGEGETGAILEPSILDSIYFDSQGMIDDSEEGGAVQTITISGNEDEDINPIEVSLDLSMLTMYVGDSTVRTNYTDGYRSGNLISFNFGSDGVITGVYDNGRQKPLGQMAIATFENPAGLTKTGQNNFMESTNSGVLNKPLKPGVGGSGTLTPGTLEMSNVDLSKEFAEMIITQRGFQANSRIITSSDEMLQELINLKR